MKPLRYKSKEVDHFTIITFTTMEFAQEQHDEQKKAEITVGTATVYYESYELEDDLTGTQPSKEAKDEVVQFEQQWKTIDLGKQTYQVSASTFGAEEGADLENQKQTEQKLTEGDPGASHQDNCDNVVGNRNDDDGQPSGMSEQQEVDQDSGKALLESGQKGGSIKDRLLGLISFNMLLLTFALLVVSLILIIIDSVRHS